MRYAGDAELQYNQKVNDELWRRWIYRTANSCIAVFAYIGAASFLGIFGNASI